MIYSTCMLSDTPIAGSPLIGKDTNNKTVQVGIVSSREGCDKDGVYSLVSEEQRWIKRQIERCQKRVDRNGSGTSSPTTTSNPTTTESSPSTQWPTWTPSTQWPTWTPTLMPTSQAPTSSNKPSTTTKSPTKSPSPTYPPSTGWPTYSPNSPWPTYYPTTEEWTDWPTWMPVRDLCLCIECVHSLHTFTYQLTLFLLFL